ncbi:hypothetical protein VTH06DRAFT_6739 [Thermothelomyces fergusii]
MQGTASKALQRSCSLACRYPVFCVFLTLVDRQTLTFFLRPALNSAREPPDFHRYWTATEYRNRSTNF